VKPDFSEHTEIARLDEGKKAEKLSRSEGDDCAQSYLGSLQPSLLPLESTFRFFHEGRNFRFEFPAYERSFLTEIVVVKVLSRAEQ
jgi:hypothetical protein